MTNNNKNNQSSSSVSVPKFLKYEYENLINSYQMQEALSFQRKYIADHQGVKFDFFGYFYDDKDFPYFESTDKKHTFDMLLGDTVIPTTPDLLKFCVKNMTISTLKLEARNIDFFKRKCEHVSEMTTVFSKKMWDKAIQACVDYVMLPHHLSGSQLRHLIDNLTIEQLKSLDFNMFGKLAKPFMPPSYSKKPELVNVYNGKDNIPTTELVFSSTTLPSKRKFVIKKGSVSVFVNGSEIGKTNEYLSTAWKDFCGASLEEYAETQNKPENNCAKILI